jgi:hypothetical protein
MRRDSIILFLNKKGMIESKDYYILEDNKVYWVYINRDKYKQYMLYNSSISSRVFEYNDMYILELLKDSDMVLT